MSADLDMATVTLDEAVSVARQAQDARDFDRALSAWQSVRAEFAASPAGTIGVAGVLSQMHRAGEAAIVLEEGLAKFPGSEKIAVDHAWVAHHAGDWPESDRRWSAVRARFPESLAGYFGGGATLRFLGRYDEADRLYQKALRHWPNATNLMADYAAVAQARGDLAEAAIRWNALRAAFPDEPGSYLREARELRLAGHFDRAEQLLSQALKRFPGNQRAMVEHAQVAQQRGNPAEALKRWDAMATAFHGVVDGYVGAAQCLNDLGRFADAQTVLQPALRLFPESVDVAALNAWIAHYLADFGGAVERWTELRRRFPSQVVGYTGGVTSLLALKKDAEASALIDDAVRLFPKNTHVAMEHARLPQNSQDWDEAQRRWAALHARFPGNGSVASGYAQMLSRAARWDDAEALLGQAVIKHGGELWARKAFAECAAQRDDWPTAEARWRAVIDHFPDRIAGWSGLADMLRSRGRLDEAQAALAQALEKFPANLELEKQLANTVTLRRDWPHALRLWSELKRVHPRNAGVLGAIKQALWQAQQDLGVAAAEGGPVPFEIPANLTATEAEDNASLRDLFMGFESIGDTCEFGIVQRRFGAEPISLLRWASTPPLKLIKVLETRFDGVGDPEHTIVSVVSGEYTTRDKRYHMFSHTFTPETAEPLEQFTKQHLRRMQYLRRKLIDDLAEGEKIFVYKCNQGLSLDDARAIHRAILGYGGVQALLCVRLEDNKHPCGTLETLSDGLFVGYIDRFSTVDINVDVWVELCRKADAAWREKERLS